MAGSKNGAMTQTPLPHHTDLKIARLQRLRVVALAEGMTLLALVGIAVPLKHLAGFPSATSLLGPIHGMAFLAYFWMLFNVVSSDDWTRNEVARLVVAALVPFGALLSAGLLKRKLVALSLLTPQARSA